MMGNNVVCKIIEIGNIRLKLYDVTIRELKQVRFVPDLKRNLIFWVCSTKWDIVLGLNIGK